VLLSMVPRNVFAFIVVYTHSSLYDSVLSGLSLGILVSWHAIMHVVHYNLYHHL
jgi:hypothetical protein